MKILSGSDWKELQDRIRNLEEACALRRDRVTSMIDEMHDLEEKLRSTRFVNDLLRKKLRAVKKALRENAT